MIKIPAVMFAPETVKLAGTALAEPYVVVTAVNTPLAVMVAPAPLVIVRFNTADPVPAELVAEIVTG